MQVDGGLFQIAMPQQKLNGAQVGTVLEQVGGETVAQCVRMDLFILQTGASGSMTAGVINSLGSDGAVRGMAASSRE
jgi:hypothetical protein